jgi:hypothetical protein
MLSILPIPREYSILGKVEYRGRVTRMQNRPLEPEEQLKVLSRIWGNDRDGYVFLPWIDGTARDRSARRKNYHEGRAFRWPREKGAILEHLRSHDGDDLYFAPSLFNGKRRIEHHAEPERALWADLDPVNPRGLGDRRPTIAWESSPGRFQGVWLLSTMRQGASWAGHENHRLTVEIGADPSGWDTTQLLRVPGRRNHKPDYGDEPVEGRLLWLDGPRYTWDDFDDLPPIGQVQGGEDPDLLDDDLLNTVDRHEVWARVRLKVSKPVREYMAARTSEGADRSDVLWQIERDLADAGCTLAEIIAVVRPTVWNKYKDRNDELKRLKVEAAKALADVANGVDDGALEAVHEDDKPEGTIWLDDVIAQGIPRPRWLVRNVWARGSCGFISGAPKSYKSWISLDLATTIATGKTFLNDPQHPVVGGPRPVLMLLEEDDDRLVISRLAQVLEAKAPELYWHGQLSLENGEVVWEAPRRRIPLGLHIGKGFVASDEGWQAWLDERIRTDHFAAVVIDTLGTTAGEIDTDRASEVMARMLRPLKVLSQKHNCAMIVVHHNKKDDGHTRGGRNMLGSVALHAWVENALYVSTKETGPRGTTTVKVDRESKQAQDYQFRVRIPLMRTHDDGTRTLWTPEVLAGWGDADEGVTTPDAEATSSQDSSQPREPKRRGRNLGLGIARQMRQMGYLRRGAPVAELVERLQQDKRLILRHLADAVRQGFVVKEGDLYRVVSIPSD